MLNQLNYVRSRSMLTHHRKFFILFITLGNKHNKSNIFCLAGNRFFPGENCHKFA